MHQPRRLAIGTGIGGELEPRVASHVSPRASTFCLNRVRTRLGVLFGCADKGVEKAVSVQGATKETVLSKLQELVGGK